MTGVKKVLIIFLHAVAGWALCGAVMGAGPLFMSMQNTLIVHAIAAPVFFAALSTLYFYKFNFTTPLLTALVFVSFVVLVDFFIVALLILGTLEMFTSPLGTWIPFVLIFLATFITGAVCRRTGASATAGGGWA
jgi:hypothetical protein